MNSTAVIIGNSDGIGRALTRELLTQGWMVSGISRSASTVKSPEYQHNICRVQDPGYPAVLQRMTVESPVDLCVYCAGIGEPLDPLYMDNEVETLEVNLLGMVKTAAIVIPAMVDRGQGHFIGLSSVADELLYPEAPGYHASKAGLSSYLESLALALKSQNVYVTNVRFGFVDTKMAKGDVRPFMLSVEQATRHLFTCIEKKPIRSTAPRIVIPLVKFRRWMMRLKTF